MRNGCGYINVAGEFVAPPVYDGVTHFSEGRGHVRTGRAVGYVSREGDEVIPTRYGYADWFHEGLAAAMDWDPRVHASATPPASQAALEKNQGVGYIDASGRYTIEPSYVEAQEFSEGLAAVACELDSWAFIDRSGEMRPVNGRRVRPFREGRAQFEASDGRCGFLGPDLDVVIPATYAGAGDFSDGLAWATEDYGQACSYFLGPDGERVLRFDAPCDMEFSDGLLAVREGDLWGYVNRQQEWVIRPAFDFCYPFLEQMTTIQVDGMWGFLTAQGDIAVEPRYDGAWPFSEGLAAVRVGPVWGFINASGDMVIDPQFGEAGMFHEGRCAAAVPSDVAQRIS